MQYKAYCDIVQRGADAFNEGKYMEAIEAFESLMSTDITDLDKALMCNNIAVSCEKMGYVDQALEWFDEGIRLETPFFRTKLMTYKAHFLVNVGRENAAVPLYEHLLSLPYVTEAEKEEVWNSMTLIKNKRN